VNPEGQVVKVHPYPEIFTYTLYITSFLLFPFFCSIPLIMNKGTKTSTQSKFLYWLGAILGLIIVPSTFLVGYYDWRYNFLKHVAGAQTTLAAILIFMVVWTIADVLQKENHPYKSKSIMKLDITAAIIIIVCSYTQTGLPVPKFMTFYIT